MNSVEELIKVHRKESGIARKSINSSSVNGPTSANNVQIPFRPPPPPSAQPPATSTSQAQSSSISPAVAEYTAAAKSGVKTLSTYIDIDKFLALPERELNYLWRLRHINNPTSLHGIVSAENWTRIVAAAKKHPQFILPLPREGQGAEIHFMQWTFPSETTATVLFTHLAEYKLRGEFTQPHTTVTHHTDLMAEKGVVLVEGTVMPDRGVTVEEGQWLLMCLLKFYGQDGTITRQEGSESITPRRRLLEQFSKGDGEFKIEDLLEEAEKVP